MFSLFKNVIYTLAPWCGRLELHLMCQAPGQVWLPHLSLALCECARESSRGPMCEARNFFQFSYLGDGGELSQSICSCFPVLLAGSWVTSGAAETQTGMHTECWHWQSVALCINCTTVPASEYFLQYFGTKPVSTSDSFRFTPQMAATGLGQAKPGCRNSIQVSLLSSFGVIFCCPPWAHWQAAGASLWFAGVVTADLARTLQCQPQYQWQGGGVLGLLAPYRGHRGQHFE